MQEQEAAVGPDLAYQTHGVLKLSTTLVSACLRDYWDYAGAHGEALSWIKRAIAAADTIDHRILIKMVQRRVRGTVCGYAQRPKGTAGS